MCKKSISSIFALVALTGYAGAADLGGPSYEGSLKDDYVAPVAHSWTGFYLGANIGWAWSGNITAALTPANAATQEFLDDAITEGWVPSKYEVKADGAIGGVQAGYNWQSGSVVFGLEADVSRAELGSSINILHPGVVTNTFRFDINWLTTLRGRLGFAASPATLLYLTGGFAFANIEQSTLTRASFEGNAFSGSSSDMAYGWTLGGGIEWAMSRNWTLRGEYLFVRLDVENFSTGALSGNCSNVTMNCVLNVSTRDIDLHIARLGLNYKF